MRNENEQLSVSARCLRLLEAVVEDGGHANLSQIARSIALPIPTAHRQAADLVAQGFLTVAGRGLHVAGPRMRRLVGLVDEKQIIAACAAPFLRKLARRFSCVAQLGTLEHDMVTYRVKAGHRAHQLFTRTDMQLEAYCSGLGKALLAWLPPAELDDYVAGGPFIPLTPTTIVDGHALRSELAKVRVQGYAEDRGEILANLFCFALPIRHPQRSVSAAISVSKTIDRPELDSDFTKRADQILSEMTIVAKRIEELAFAGIHENNPNR
jgi:IclR family acetate operon transcriptional repressor